MVNMVLLQPNRTAIRDPGQACPQCMAITPVVPLLRLNKRSNSATVHRHSTHFSIHNAQANARRCLLALTISVREVN